MSTDARSRSWSKPRFALLGLLILAACAKSHEHAEWDAFKHGFAEAVLRRDFDAVYPLVRAHLNREALEYGLAPVWITRQPISPDDNAVFRTGWLLAFGYEDMINPYKYPADYNEELRQPPLRDERLKAAVVWLRRAADRGVVETAGFFAIAYQDGRGPVPKDDELAKCFDDAWRSRIVMTICRRLEQAKGYDPGS